MLLVLTKEGNKILKRLNKDLELKCKELKKNGGDLNYGNWICSLEGKDKLVWYSKMWGYINEKSVSLDRLCWKHSLKEWENKSVDEVKNKVCELILNNVLTIK